MIRDIFGVQSNSVQKPLILFIIDEWIIKNVLWQQFALSTAEIQFASNYYTGVLSLFLF